MSLSPPNMTLCEKLHLLGMGCTADNKDPDCEECPYNQMGIIKSRYPDLKGKDWINTISEEDRQALIYLWRKAGSFGRLGGIARARTAKRDHRGRFIKGEKPDD